MVVRGNKRRLLSGTFRQKTHRGTIQCTSILRRFLLVVSAAAGKPAGMRYVATTGTMEHCVSVVRRSNLLTLLWG